MPPQFPVKRPVLAGVFVEPGIIVVANTSLRLLRAGLSVVAAAFAANFAFAESVETYSPHAKAVVTKGLIHIEDGLDYTMPADAGLRFVKLEEEWSVATFTGRITLSGTYYYGQLADYPGDDLIGLYFLPDAKDAKRLPHWKQQGVVKEINFQNAGAFIKAVIPAKIARAVKRGRRASVQGRATIVADGFQVAVSCGSPIYVTRFQSLAVEPKLYAARKTVERTTC